MPIKRPATPIQKRAPSAAASKPVAPAIALRSEPAEKRARKKYTVAVPNTTRDRLILASIELFNRHGVPNVPLSQIAAAVDISPGNLTYHFKRRDDLVYAAFLVLEQRMQEALTQRAPSESPDPQVPEEAAEVLLNIIQTFWEFRFLFNALTYLLTEDTRLREAYFAFQERVLEGMAATNMGFADKGFLFPMQPHNSWRLMADNMWAQWLGWLRMQQIQSADMSLPHGEALHDCAMHHWALMRPYLKDDFAEQLLVIYNKRLLKPKARAKRKT